MKASCATVFIGIISAIQGGNSRHSDSDLLFSSSFGIGYKSQQFDFKASNVDQWYPSFPTLPHERRAGVVLTYQVEYMIPYLELALDVKRADKFSLAVAVAYAPVTNVRDEDNHLLTGLHAVADHDRHGKARFITLQGRYNLTRNWYLAAEVEKILIRSKGRSATYINGVYDHSIDNKIKSDQLSGFLTLGYLF